MSVSFTAQHRAFQVFIVTPEPPWFENCYLVRHNPTGETLIIDPGYNAASILESLDEEGCTAQAILLTHAHPDHVGAVRGVQEALHIPCHLHHGDAELLAHIVDYASRRLGLEVEPPLSSTTFTGDPGFQLGGIPFDVIAAPGHTQGGVVYAFDGFAITGDTLFNHGVGRTDLPGGNGRQLMQSITHVLDSLTDDTVLYCGHGPDWVVAEARPWWAAMRG
jgi:glyoxylase-like metal-dependent hydrolase (beta-lactamase superfamily II)